MPVVCMIEMFRTSVENCDIPKEAKEKALEGILKHVLPFCLCNDCMKKREEEERSEPQT